MVNSKKTAFLRVLRLALGIALSAISLYLALRSVSLGEILSTLSAADGLLVGLALLSVAVNTLGKALRWKILLGSSGDRVSLGSSVVALLVGQMLNTLYPARVGEVSRAYMVGSQGPGRSFTFGTVILEKLVDLLAYTMLFGLLILLVPLPTWLEGSLAPFLGVVGLAMAAVWLFARRPGFALSAISLPLRLLPRRFGDYLLSRSRAGLDCLVVLRGRPAVLRLAVLTALVWGTAVLTNQLTLLALRVHLPWTASLLILVVLQAGISLPSVPGRIGIFEALCILSLAVFGIDQAPALSYGILLHAIVFIPTTLLGLLFFTMLGLRQTRVASPNM